MSKDVVKSQIKTLKGPIYCAVGGVFAMAALAYAIHVSAFPNPQSQLYWVWGCLLIAAPIGFFFLSLGLKNILQELRK